MGDSADSSDRRGPAGRSAGAGHDLDAAIAGGDAVPARAPLDRDRIVAAALTYVDAHGLAGLTMRRLGDRLGVEAMSLYRYVPGKEDLLDAVVEALLDVLERDPDVLVAPTDGWQDFLQRLAHGIRRAALAHPKAFPLVASRPPEAPWLRPPLRSLVWVERFLVALTDEGFDAGSAVAAYRSFTSFLLGHLLLEVAGHGADVGPLDVVDDGSVADEGLADYPAVAALRSELSQDHAALEFEDALESLLDRLTLLRAEG
ncbi:TetR/AcrR family transcriptional regulator C-terminal domain-containing protein [Nocardioides lentus]|uniref:TetR/AcrR family transcriptional regulator C-terminal domain-containing protein n=1 Tax=Nocardioides lentus TaxID=338077 RepID=A0ABP5A819_9ACTN